MKPAVVLCSEDPELYMLLRHILAAEGYRCLLVGALSEIAGAPSAVHSHAIILDCSAVNFDAIELCRQIKTEDATKGIPIAALIGPGKTDQFLKLLKAGVSDGLVRPLVPDNLLHFLRGATPVTMQTAGGPLPHAPNVLSQGPLAINLDAGTVTLDGRRLDVSPIGVRLLSHLLRFPNCVHSREDLVDVLWDQEKERVDPRRVDVHVSRLRKSLETDCRLCPIKTVRSCGYILEAAILTQDMTPC